MGIRALDRRTLARAGDEVAEICRSTADLAEVLASVSDALRPALQHHGAFLGVTDPATTVFTTTAVIESLPETMCAPWMENEFLIDDVNKFVDLHRNASPARTLHRSTGGRPGTSARYVDVNRPAGFGAELRRTCSVAGACWGVVHLVREESAPDFTDEQVALVDRVAPVLAEAMRGAARTRRVGTPATDPRPGVITLDPRGHVVSMTDRATELIGELGHGPIQAGPGADLPGEAYMVATSARAGALGRPAPPPWTRLRTRSGHWLTLRGDCSRAPDGTVASTVLVIEPSQPSEILPLVVAAHGLTAREQEVLTELASGRATCEIAARLAISEHTVRDHVKSLFAKTGTGSRGELVHQLFTAHSYPRTEFHHR